MPGKEPPTQVVYRFDDHRFLELKGWGCEGELWYTDTLGVFIHQGPSVNFIGFSPKNLFILLNDILPYPPGMTQEQ
ncbi:T6SS immunity protein Tli3 family protein [Enterobacter hormaechei]